MVGEILEPFVGRNVLDGGVGMFVRHVARTEPAGDLRLALRALTNDRVGRWEVGLGLLDGFAWIDFGTFIERLDLDIGLGDFVDLVAIFHARRCRRPRAGLPRREVLEEERFRER